MITVTEEWRPVVGAEGRYEVSSHGMIRRAAPGVNARVGQTLAQAVSPQGYYQATLSGWPKHPVVPVHRIVAEAFLGARPPGLVINHKDSDRLNNRADNLEYVSYQENTHHAQRMGRIPVAAELPPPLPDDSPRARPTLRGSKAHSAKLTEDQVSYVLTSKERGADLARRFGVSQAAISLIRSGRRWRHQRGEG